MRKTKSQRKYKLLEYANHNKAKLPQDEAIELYNNRLKDFGICMWILASQGRLFEKDYKGNLRCVNPDKGDNNE